jgi:hypothetical protein
VPGEAWGFHIQLTGLVSEYFTGDPMRGVQVRLVKDSIERETVLTQRNGRYELYLERGYDYLIWFHREDLVTKYVRIDARDIPLFPDVPYYEMDLQMTMFRWIDKFDFTIFNDPVGMAAYRHSVRNMYWNVDYTTRRRTAVQRVMVLYERELAAIEKAERMQRMKSKSNGRRKPVHF